MRRDGAAFPCALWFTLRLDRLSIAIRRVEQDFRRWTAEKLTVRATVAYTDVSARSPPRAMQRTPRERLRPAATVRRGRSPFADAGGRGRARDTLGTRNRGGRPQT